MTRSTSTAVNRCVLGVMGLALLLTGWWATTADRARADRSSWVGPHGAGWWTPAVMTASIALTVLFALWFLSRFRRGPMRRFALPSPGCTVRARALAEALADRVATVPGVARGRARVLPRRGRRLEVELRVWLETGTAPEPVLPALHAMMAEAATAVAPYTTHARVRLSAVSHRKPHVR
ncbi:hypothetical protein [Streptomyces sp. NPDC086777]|uniref:hypothetical protein n=1 Tax=Streptomyces sp. NPDC086777 TaxID=3154866 RepID=UPI00344E8079